MLYGVQGAFIDEVVKKVCHGVENSRLRPRGPRIARRFDLFYDARGKSRAAGYPRTAAHRGSERWNHLPIREVLPPIVPKAVGRSAQEY